jgi:phage terminase large subunit
VSNIQIPEWLYDFLVPAPYKVAYGGRGSGKSWGFARMAILRAIKQKTRFLCARELQNSIAESVHHLLSNQIISMGVHGWFDVGESYIRCANGSEFIFRGLRGMRNDASSLKSLEDVDVCWVEEGQTISKASLTTLTPTIRNDNSEIWITFNPDQETDPVYENYVINKPPECLVRRVNWSDNPWFPARLEHERQWMAKTDPDAYAWVWEGECRKVSDAQVLKGKWRVEWFIPGDDWDGPYYGADWGFAQDPTTLVKVWMRCRTLYVEYEAWAIECEIDKTPELFDTVPRGRVHLIRADSARPETIAYMQRNGYPLLHAVSKWHGSVEDGISWLRGCEEIIIHPRCKKTAEEARLYSFKVDSRSGDIKPEAEDKNNHLIDAIRYACQPLIRERSFIQPLHRVPAL